MDDHRSYIHNVSSCEIKARKKFRPEHNLFPWQCYFNMSLNLVNWLYQRYNNVKINKNATAGLYVNSNIMSCYDPVNLTDFAIFFESRN